MFRYAETQPEREWTWGRWLSFLWCPLHQTLSNHIFLSKSPDIEECVQLGKQLKACPYYGARTAIKSAELVILPYASLLHEATRNSLNINLHGNIVIIDEAHNLIETINNLYSVEINVAQLSSAHSQLSQYLERYKSRLSAKNSRNVQKILVIIKSFLKFLSNQTKPSSTEISNDKRTLGGTDLSLNNENCRIMSTNDFLFDCNIENFNVFKLENYFENSKIVQKVNGFADKVNMDVNMNENTMLGKRPF